MLNQNKEKVNMLKEQFRNTITTEQRQQLRLNMGTNNASETGNELRETVRKQRQNNNSGGGKGKGSR
jgi:tripartite-type tricarboxylate transporter receptor subunit TctC